MEIKNYIRELKKFEKSIPKAFDTVVKREKQLIFNAIKTRLYGTGTDGKGNFIGQYKNSTIRRWKKRTTFITLFNTGNFYKKLELTSKKGIVDIFSKDKKNNLLHTTYGQNILSLTEEEEKLIHCVVGHR